MKVILTEKVPKLGNVGEMVKVSVGHARNYLLPNRLAVIASDSNKSELENNKRSLQKKIQAEKDLAIGIKEKLDGMKVEVSKKVGGSGKLFGTVTTQEIASILSGKGVEIEKRLIAIEKPIKGLGLFDIKAKLFSDVESIFQVSVTMDPEQAKEEKKKLEVAAKKKSKDKNKKNSDDKEEKTEDKETEEKE